MTHKIHKTNAVRILDQAKISYEMVAYPVDQEHIAADVLALKLGIDPRIIFKTLVMRGDKTGSLVCVIPSDCEVDLKKVARATGNKKVDMLHLKELQPLTGYVRGGCSPIGMKKQLPTFFHKSVQEYLSIYVNGGERGLQIVASPLDLIRICKAETVDLISSNDIEV